MYCYLADGFYLWTGPADRMDAADFEVVDFEELSDRAFQRLDARSKAVGKKLASQCNPKPVTNSKGQIIRPATFPCGSVCRQKKNCGVSRSATKTIEGRLKGRSEEELRRAILEAKRKKRQGQSETSAVYAATQQALRDKESQRREKRYERSVSAAEKRAKGKSLAGINPEMAGRLKFPFTLTGKGYQELSKEKRDAALHWGKKRWGPLYTLEEMTDGAAVAGKRISDKPFHYLAPHKSGWAVMVNDPDGGRGIPAGSLVGKTKEEAIFNWYRQEDVVASQKGVYTYDVPPEELLAAEKRRQSSKQSKSLEGVSIPEKDGDFISEGDIRGIAKSEKLGTLSKARKRDAAAILQDLRDRAGEMSWDEQVERARDVARVLGFEDETSEKHGGIVNTVLAGMPKVKETPPKPSPAPTPPPKPEPEGEWGQKLKELESAGKAADEKQKAAAATLPEPKPALSLGKQRQQRRIDLLNQAGLGWIINDPSLTKEEAAHKIRMGTENLMRPMLQKAKIRRQMTLEKSMVTAAKMFEAATTEGYSVDQARDAATEILKAFGIGPRKHARAWAGMQAEIADALLTASSTYKSIRKQADSEIGAPEESTKSKSTPPPKPEPTPQPAPKPEPKPAPPFNADETARSFFDGLSATTANILRQSGITPESIAREITADIPDSSALSSLKKSALSSGGMAVVSEGSLYSRMNNRLGNVEQRDDARDVLAAVLTHGMNRHSNHPLSVLPDAEMKKFGDFSNPKNARTYLREVEDIIKVQDLLANEGYALSSDRDGFTVTGHGETRRFKDRDEAWDFWRENKGLVSDNSSLAKSATLKPRLRNVGTEDDPAYQLTTKPLPTHVPGTERISQGSFLDEISGEDENPSYESGVIREFPRTITEFARAKAALEARKRKASKVVSDGSLESIHAQGTAFTPVERSILGSMTPQADRDGNITHVHHLTKGMVPVDEFIAATKSDNVAAGINLPRTGSSITFQGKPYVVGMKPSGVSGEIHDEITGVYLRPGTPAAQGQRSLDQLIEEQRQAGIQQQLKTGKGTPDYVTALLSQDGDTIRRELGRLDLGGFKKQKMTLLDGTTEEGYALPGSEFNIIKSGSGYLVGHGPSGNQHFNRNNSRMSLHEAKAFVKLLTENGVKTGGKAFDREDPSQAKFVAAVMAAHEVSGYEMSPIAPDKISKYKKATPVAPQPGSAAFDRLAAQVRAERDAAWEKRNAKETISAGSKGFSSTDRKRIGEELSKKLPPEAVAATNQFFQGGAAGEKAFADYVKANPGLMVSMLDQVSIPVEDLPRFLEIQDIDVKGVSRVKGGKTIVKFPEPEEKAPATKGKKGKPGVDNRATKMQRETGRKVGDGFTPTMKAYIAQSVIDQLPDSALAALTAHYGPSVRGRNPNAELLEVASGKTIALQIPGAGSYKIPVQGLFRFLQGAGIDMTKVDELLKGVKFDSTRGSRRFQVRLNLLRNALEQQTYDPVFPDIYRTDSRADRFAAGYALAIRYQAESLIAGAFEALRLDSCRLSCGECLRKHLGSAIVCAHEVEAGYPHHDLLVIGHLSEAEQESARDNPALAEGIRELRRQFQHGHGLHFEDVVDLLQEHLETPFTVRADSAKKKTKPTSRLSLSGRMPA